jgi:type IX secretion system PorP/SprF family membrane protein
MASQSVDFLLSEDDLLFVADSWFQISKFKVQSSKFNMKRLANLVIISLFSLSLSGQLTPVTNQYVLNPITINPSYAGSRGALNIMAFYRRQWIGIAGSPETMTFSIDAPLSDEKIGIGLNIVNDKIGVTKETQFMSSYSYKIKTRDGVLSFGLGAGIMTTNTAWSDLIVQDPGDENYLVDSRVFVVPDFNFGIYYSYKNYFAGFSIPKLLGYTFNYDKNQYSLKVDPGQYYYLLNTGYLFTISKKVKVLPSALITYSPGEKVLYDVNVHINYSDRLWVGASYRNNRSVAALLQFAVNNQLRIAYTYDFDIGELGRYSNGSHEIMLRYEFRFKVEGATPLSF